MKNGNLCLCCDNEDEYTGVFDNYVMIIDVIRDKIIAYLRDNNYHSIIHTINELDNGKLVATAENVYMLLIFDITNLNNIIIDYINLEALPITIVQLKNNEMGVAVIGRSLKIYETSKPYNFINEMNDDSGSIDWLHYMKSKDFLFCNSRNPLSNDLIINDITTKQKKVHFTQFKCLVKDSIVEISNYKVLLIHLDEFTVININTFTIDKRFSFLGMKYGNIFTFSDKTMGLRISISIEKRIIFYLNGNFGVIDILDETLNAYPCSFKESAKGMNTITSNTFTLYNNNIIILFKILD